MGYSSIKLFLPNSSRSIYFILFHWHTYGIIIIIQMYKNAKLSIGHLLQLIAVSLVIIRGRYVIMGYISWYSRPR